MRGGDPVPGHGCLARGQAFNGPGLYKDGKKVLDFSEAFTRETPASSGGDETSQNTASSPKQLLLKGAKIKGTDKHKFREQVDFVSVILECRTLVETIRQKLLEGEEVDQELQTLRQKKSALISSNQALLVKYDAAGKGIGEKGYERKIHDRHTGMVDRHKENMRMLADRLDAVFQAKERQELHGALDSLILYYQENIFKPDPPLVNSRTPLAHVYKKEAPAIQREASSPPFQAAGVDAAMPPTQADLAQTIDIKFTPAITALAASLDNSPLKIYEYIRNNFTFEPYLGSRKGARQTLDHRSGSDYDLASLLIALLRVSNIPARYGTGLVEMPVELATNWLGVEDARAAGGILTTAGMEGVNIMSGETVVAIQCRRVWVEAYIPYTNYRGAGGDPSGKMWVPMDPAFKQYEYHPGIDIPAAMGFNAKTFVEGYYATFHAPSPVELYKKEITDYLAVSHPGLTYEDILRTRKLRPEALGIIPGSLPYTLLSRDTSYSEIPANRRYRIRFSIHGEGATLDYTANLPEIAGKQVTISYEAATPADQQIIDDSGGLFGVAQPWLVRLKPVLKVDGCPVATGAGEVTMGMIQNSDMYFTPPQGAGNVVPAIYNEIIAGTYQGIGIDTWNVVTHPFAVPSTTCEEEYTGYLLHDTALKYLGRVDSADEEVNKTMQMVTLNDVAEAIVEHVVNVTYSWGSPITFEWSGLRVDADRKIVGPFSVTGANESCDFMRLTGADGSISENRVFEDHFEEEAVSTIKILELASDQGIPILQFNAANAGTIFNALNLSASVENAIYNAVMAGHVVTVPKNNITYFDWTGTGYIDMTPADCAAGYIISGGRNGGETVKEWDFNPSAYCINAAINSLSPVMPKDQYGAGDMRGLTFNTIIYPYNDSCQAQTSYGKAFSTLDPPLPLTIHDIATRHGAGEYTFTVGSIGGCTGNCGTAQKKFTIFSIDSITPDCSQVGMAQTISLKATYQPAGLNRTAIWSIDGATLGSSVSSSGGDTATFSSGNTPGTVLVRACDTAASTTCASITIPIEGCLECQGNATVNKPNGTLSATECCFEGETVSKTGLSINDLLAKCPTRTQNTRLHEIDGCSNVPDNPAVSPYAQAPTAFGSVQGVITSAGAASSLPCNQHDICYQTCRSIRATCDSNMKNGMDVVCARAFPAQCPYTGVKIILCPDYFVARNYCFLMSSTYYRGLRIGGGGAWNDRQTQYCDCCP